MPYYEKVQNRRIKRVRTDIGSWEEEGVRYQKSGRSGKKGSITESDKYHKSGIYSDEKIYQKKRTASRSNDSVADSFEEKKHVRPKRSSFEKIIESNNQHLNASRNAASFNSESRRPKPAEDTKAYALFEYHGVHETPSQEESTILCGRNPIREALRHGRDIEKLLVQKGELNGSAREIVQMAREKKILVQEVDRRRLDDIALHHQGLIAFASAYEYSDVEDILAEAERRNEDPFLVLLDGVTDPHNLGAIIRTAECAGAHGVILPTHRSVGLTPAAVKASAGAIEHIKVARVLNLNKTIDALKRKGIWTYAVTMNGKDYEKTDFHGGTALVIGAEGEGISRLTAEKCDMSVSLPMLGKIDSLNASVAAGIVMYRVLSCRRKS